MGRQHGGSLVGLKVPSSESSANVRDRWGAVDLVRAVWPVAALREMQEIDRREDAQCDSWPEAEHEQRVGEVMPVEVDDVPRAADDRVVRKPWCDLTKAAR